MELAVLYSTGISFGIIEEAVRRVVIECIIGRFWRVLFLNL